MRTANRSGQPLSPIDKRDHIKIVTTPPQPLDQFQPSEAERIDQMERLSERFRLPRQLYDSACDKVDCRTVHLYGQLRRGFQLDAASDHLAYVIGSIERPRYAVWCCIRPVY